MVEHKRYAEEFKLQAAQLIVEHGYTYRQASEQLGVHGWNLLLTECSKNLTIIDPVVVVCWVVILNCLI